MFNCGKKLSPCKKSNEIEKIKSGLEEKLLEKVKLLKDRTSLVVDMIKIVFAIFHYVPPAARISAIEAIQNPDLKEVLIKYSKEIPYLPKGHTLGTLADLFTSIPNSQVEQGELREK
jgi:hypothetical protein